MQRNVRMLFTLGCVSLLAMSVPAFSQPKPGEAKAKSAVQRAAQGKANAKAKTLAGRSDNAPRLVSMPVTQASARPALGWPVLVSEARKYMGTNPTDRKRLWCATFMNMVLAKVGYSGTNSDAAKSFAQYGHRISEPKVGAIAVLTRGKRGGHVGVVSGIDAQGNPVIISGNHNRSVGESVYPRARVIAYVMPSEGRPLTTEIAARSAPNASSAASRAASEPGIDSPITELLAAIEKEQARPEVRAEPARPRAPQVAQAPQAPPVPHRAVQQVPEETPQSAQGARRTLPLDPTPVSYTHL